MMKWLDSEINRCLLINKKDNLNKIVILFFEIADFVINSEEESRRILGVGGVEQLNQPRSCYVKNSDTNNIQKLKMPFIKKEEIKVIFNNSQR